MFATVMSILSAIRSFSTVSVYGDVINVLVEDVVLGEDWDEVVPEEYDEDAMENAVEALEALASSVDYVPYAHDTYHFGGFEVHISYTSYDI